MKVLVALLAFFTFATIFSPAQTSQKRQRKVLPAYELYSWQQSDGTWNFSVLPSPSGIPLRSEQIVDSKRKLRGLDQLKASLSKLPSGTLILWPHQPEDAAKQNVRFQHPPKEIMDELGAYAKAKGLKIDFFE